MGYLETIGKNAKKAFEDLKTVKHNKIKKVLESYNKSLLKNKKKIIKENQKDIKNVRRKHLIDRLILNDKRIEGIRHSINEIAKFLAVYPELLFAAFAEQTEYQLACSRALSQLCACQSRSLLRRLFAI